MMPADDNLCESCAYLLASSPFAVQRSVIKNLSASNLRLSCCKKMSLSSRFVYCAVRASSKICMNNSSIFTPSV